MYDGLRSLFNAASYAIVAPADAVVDGHAVVVSAAAEYAAEHAAAVAATDDGNPAVIDHHRVKHCDLQRQPRRQWLRHNRQSSDYY